ncbi:hypothetical protein HHK36_024980 [Tetracentron sinense]|uniref:Morc S5 domain-containing protein n=1 Tax=Tetracentron sinense TaxID=13715 RepID=A0A835D805_TETSI|nr:hypothetical protein HHK36_024980 [Tetracentron sinense]
MYLPPQNIIALIVTDTRLRFKPLSSLVVDSPRARAFFASWDIGVMLTHPTSVWCKWKAPPADHWGINTDGSVRTTMAGIRCVIRNHLGDPLVGVAGGIVPGPILVVELLAIQRGLAEAVSKGLRKVVVFSDSKGAVDAINNRVEWPWEAYQCLLRISGLMRLFDSVIVHHVFREANRAADFLSSFCHRIEEVILDPREFPSVLSRFIEDDARGCNYARINATEMAPVDAVDPFFKYDGALIGALQQTLIEPSGRPNNSQLHTRKVLLGSAAYTVPGRCSNSLYLATMRYPFVRCKGYPRPVLLFAQLNTFPTVKQLPILDWFEPVKFENPISELGLKYLALEMSFTDIVDLCSDDEIGEADVTHVKQKPDSVSATIRGKEYCNAEQLPQHKSQTLCTRQEFEENRDSNALNDGQSCSSILDQGDSPVEESSLSSASPGCPAPICRQFWKAGNYNFGLGSKVALQNGKNHLRVHPKFLHSNATSHKWAFGAIAELLDNAIQNGATFVVVDKISNPRDGRPALLIQDDGGGMDPESMRRCMSFGFSDKKSKSSIGQYGNGFKTSTMRLGADVIVFSRHMTKRTLTQSIGLLSYTFLRQTGHDRIVVPMVSLTSNHSVNLTGFVDYKLNTSTGTLGTLLRYGQEHFMSNLSRLLQWSPYTTEAELLKQVNFVNLSQFSLMMLDVKCFESSPILSSSFNSHFEFDEQFDDIGQHGTKVIIYNLWFNDDGDTELDFVSDAEDIRISGDSKTVHTGYYPVPKTISEQHIANRFHYSLRVYSSILYLRIPQSFRIILRGRVVQHHNFANDLKFPEFILYKPKVGGDMEAAVVTTIGFLKDAPHVNIHGFNIYHRNRLILPFWRVVSQITSRGRGVVGVLEANFIEPTHNKQDFEKTPLFQKLEGRLKQMTLEYWDIHCALIGYHQAKKTPPTPVPLQDSPLSRRCSSLQQPVIINHSSTAIKSPRAASAGGAIQDSVATSSHLSVGRPGQSIGNYQTCSQHGMPIKRKEQGPVVEPELVKRQARTVANATDTRHNWETQPANGIENQLKDQEATSLMEENKKLHAKCLEYEKREEELNLKMQRLRSELGEVQCEYARLLAEAQSIDAVKEEKHVHG